MTFTRFAVLLVVARAFLAAGTTVLFDPATPATGPFPTDYLTVADPAQRTGLRVNLPQPDCSVPMTSCLEFAMLNELDGFSTRARATVRFSGPVDTSTLGEGIFFVAQKGGVPITVDQMVFDPSTNTAYAKPSSALEQGARYALIVTNAVKDAAGDPVVADPAFQACMADKSGDYCTAMAQALSASSTGTIIPVSTVGFVVAASIFTTMSTTAWIENARAALDAVPPAVTLLAPQSSFHIPDLARITLHEQTGDNPVQFTNISLPLPGALLAGLDRLVIGSFQSPNFLQGDSTIALNPTSEQVPAPPQQNQIYFNLLLPSAPKPANGYPVVIFGHGLGDSRFGGPTAVSATLARAGFATIAINAVGHGFGPLSTVTFTDTSGNSTTVPAGGRSVDLNADGTIGADEGCVLTFPMGYGTRDCFRQTVIDLMQLTRAISGIPDLDPGHIYYGGQSLGAMYGTIFTAVEPAVRAAVLNVGGGTEVDIARESPAYRGDSTQILALRTPPLLNAGKGYNEDYPLPAQPVRVVTVKGAMAIQDLFERLEWLGMIGDPMGFAPNLRSGARPVLVQFARADRTMPNPATTNLIRAAGLQASTWEYRHDLARAKDKNLPLDPHPYLVFFVSLDGSTIQLPGADGLAISLDAQQQIAGFFAADGAKVPDPNGLSAALLGIKVFQVPATLPEDLGF